MFSLRSSFLYFLVLTGIVTCRFAQALENESTYLHLVKVVKVQQQSSFDVTRKFAAEVVAKRSLSAGFELPGTIKTIEVNEGDYVEKGQLLANLDTRLLETQLEQTQAQLAEVDASLTLNKLNQQRQQKLKTQNLAIEQLIDELNAEHTKLIAGKNRLLAAKKQIQTQIDKSILYAAFDAQITMRHKDEGAVVGASTPIFDLIEIGDLEVRVGVPKHFSNDVKLTQAVSILTTDDKRFQASVIGIVPALNSITRTSAIRLQIASEVHQEMSVVSGEVVYVELPQRHNESGFWLPTSALTEGIRGTWNVMVVEDKDSQKTLKSYSVNPLYFGTERVFVKSMLATGTEIVADGLHRVAPGLNVRTSEQ